MKPPVKLSSIGQPRVTALLYGRTGVGKTTMACGSQRLRTLLLDVDKGALAANCWLGNPSQGLAPTNRDLVEVIECDSFADVLAGYEFARARIGQYDLIIVDTATELQRMVREELCRRASLQVLDQRGWGVALTMMDDLLRAFKTLQAHIIWTAHETTAYNNDNRLMFRPLFQGQFKDWYGGAFSEVWRYVVYQAEARDAAGQVHHVDTHAVQCQYDAFSDAKDRSGALLKWERPDLDAILGKIAERVALATSGQPQKDTQADAQSKRNSNGASAASHAQPAAALNRAG